MSKIFDENNMNQILAKCIPEGEVLSAGIHGITLQINKKKTSKFDVYVGITKKYLVIAECEERKYINDFYRIPDLRKTVAEDIGTCFPLTDIRNCTIQNTMMGAVNCAITLKDGSYLKLQLPKRGGLGNGMPHHVEYRDAILQCLRTLDGGNV